MKVYVMFHQKKKNIITPLINSIIHKWDFLPEFRLEYKKGSNSYDCNVYGSVDDRSLS